MAMSTRSRRDLLSIGLALVVALSLLVAALMLSRIDGSLPTTAIPTPSLDGTPDAGGETADPQEPDFNISADDLRELSLALAAVITALTGLLGLVATQIWKGREENRVDQKHTLALERERLELERERLQLVKERLDLERQREALRTTK